MQALLSAENDQWLDGFTNGDLKDLLNNLTPYKFNYKDEHHGEGDRVGVMAQDLEKSPAGNDMVIDTDEGKMVEYDPGMFAGLMSHLDKRLTKLEDK